MPYSAPRPCRRPGCPELVRGRDGFCEAHRKAEHRRYNRDQRPDYHKMYGSPRWKARRDAQLLNQPFCERCGMIAELAHHKTPHGGDPHEFYEGQLESLCRSCHEAEHRRGVTSRAG